MAVGEDHVHCALWDPAGYRVLDFVPSDRSSSDTVRQAGVAPWESVPLSRQGPSTCVVSSSARGPQTAGTTHINIIRKDRVRVRFMNNLT